MLLGGRRSLGVVACVALVVAACTTPAVETTTTSTAATTTTVAPTTTTTIPLALRLALPVDREVRIGQLDNGLTYYLRQNDSPGRRAELRLVVNAGSLLEDEDQSGIAHFLEHMMFNGTERFPRNELIAALESFGPRFGPDINAFTNFDETIYELSLSTDDDELVQLGIDVLREWAGRATLTEQDVVEERGVILDEWRLRAQGLGGRINESFQRLILPGTVYEGRIPIGDADSIQATTPDLLRRFYENWYRPDLMAVIAVGDFDMDVMEKRIVEAFGDLESPSDPPPREPADYEPPDEARAVTLVDEEAGSASFSVFWPLQTRKLETVGDYQSAVVLSMGLNVLANRLNDDALRGLTPLLGAGGGEFGYTRAITLAGVDVEARPQDVEEALRATLVEVARIAQFGISDTEFARALTEFEAVSQQRHQQRESIQDVQLAGQIIAHHLEGSDLMSADQRFEVETGILERVTKSEIEAALARVFEAAPFVFAIAPDDPDAAVPDPDRILELVNEVAATPITAREDTGLDIDTLMAAPDPAPIVSRETNRNFGFTTLTFENGASVFLWRSDIARETVFAQVESFGGTSQIAVEDLPEAELIMDIIRRSGVGPADIPTLQRLLADRLVDVTPFISETREGLTGSSAVKDVEVLFQLIHLYMTAPRIEEVAVTAVLDEMATLNASRADIPDILFQEALIEGYYGDDPRYFALPSLEQLADFDIGVAEAVYRERFGNAGDFAFAFVGDFDIATMTDLAARYIGTLPGTPEREGFIDNQPLPPREVQVKVVEAGSDPQGRVALFFTNEFDPALKDRLTARLLALILNARLRERIREELSASYVVFTDIDLQRDPDPFAESFVNATGHPDDLALISEEIMADVVDLQVNGPTEAQFSTALEQLSTELDLVSNVDLADALITSYLYPDQPVTQLTERYLLIESLTPEDVQAMAKVAYNPRQRIEVRVVPRG